MGIFAPVSENAILAGKEKVDVSGSNMRKSIAGKLEQYGYIRGFRVVDDGRQGLMRLYLKYDESRSPAIRAIQRLSKPSCRRYLKAGEIRSARSGYGLIILSTSRGILSGKEARQQGIGGEALCEIW